MIDVIAERAREPRAAEVEGFYTHSPFPGYAAADDAGTLLDGARRSPFLAALDAAVPIDAAVLDCGCGTAQIAAFLALAAPGRRVFGVDGCGASLDCGDAFRARARIANLQLVRGDLFDMPVARASFQFVLSRGVVHHTPDPRGATRAVAECVAPGGVLLLGFYESRARLFHRVRQALARFAGRPIAFLDPLLRTANLDPEKRRIWIDDQYRHPLERCLGLSDVLGWLDELGFEWLRTIPPAVSGSAGVSGAELFTQTPRPGRLGIGALRLSWAVRGLTDPDAGLVCVVARRRG